MNLSLLSDQIASQDAIEWIGLLTGIIYVILAAYEKPSCWIFGIISSAAIAWKSYMEYLLIADAVLQVFYIVIGFVGLWNWIRGQSGAVKSIVITPIVYHAVAIIVSALISIPLSQWLVEHANAKFGYIDTLITLLSVWATVLLVKKDLHNWLYWIVLDAALVWLYFMSEGYLFALLLLIYTVIACFGFVKWSHQMKRN